MTIANFKTAFNLDGTITTLAGNAYSTNDIVYDKREYTNVAGANNPYKHNPYRINNIRMVTTGTGATSRFLAADLTTPAAPLDALASNVLAPWFYDLINVNSNKAFYGLHQSNLILLAAVETLVGTDITANWT